MTIFGLGVGAQVVLLQGVSTYAALASAYFFAKPVLRLQTLEYHRDILSNIKENENDSVHRLIEKVSDILAMKAQDEAKITTIYNKKGVVFLLFSIVIFTCAFVLQVYSDPAFVLGK